MSTLWNSLYCPSNDAGQIAAALRDALVAAGYELYNPFALSPGHAYRESIKTFTAPSADGWVRMVGFVDEAVLLALSQTALCLVLSLDTAFAPIRLYHQGQIIPPGEALTPYLHPGRTINHLEQILAGLVEATSPVPATAPLPLNLLPADIQSLAQGVNPGQAQNLFARLSGDVLKKVTRDSAQVEGARALLSQNAQPDWNSPAGQQIQALMSNLTTPENWREPDFDALRHAYPLHQRRAQRPNARLYPGDAELMNAVPDALAYLPIYGGKN